MKPQTCPECKGELWTVDGYLVCPKGHGKLIKAPRALLHEEPPYYPVVVPKTLAEISKAFREFNK